MKTKLQFLGIFLAMLFTGTMTQAQVNIEESFDSGTLPAGWENWDTQGSSQIGFTFPINASLAYIGSGYASVDAVPNLPKWMNSSSGVSNGEEIEVSAMVANNNMGSATVTLYYIVNNQMYSFTSVGGASVALVGANTPYTKVSGTIPAGTIPVGTSVKFQIRVFSTNGGPTLRVDDFKANQGIPPTFPMEYTFNNTLSNTQGNNPFSGTGTSFVTDRYSNPNSALNITSSSNSAIPSGLPIGNSPRTISLWLKNTGGFAGSPGIFAYGGNVALQKFGMYFSTTGALTFQGFGAGNDVVIPNSTISTNQWKHIVLSYDGANIRVYLDGTLLHFFAKALSTTKTNFSLGNFTGAVDDLRIYNTTLTDSEVVNLFNSQFAIATSSSPTTGGTTTGAGAYSAGTTVNLAATANTGYNFVNWTENGTVVSTNANYTFTATANRTLVANFAIPSYIITTSSSPTAGGITSGAGAYISGSSINLVAIPNSGYNFISWTENGTVVSTDSQYTFTATADRALTANFELIPTVIAEYTFDTNYDNINGNTPFTSPQTSFVEDRFGVADKALSSTNTNGITASIAGLPTGSSARTVSLWFKRISGTFAGVIYYGSEVSSGKISVFFDGGANLQFASSPNASVQLVSAGNVPTDTWHHLVVTYDGAWVRSYLNGNPVGNGVGTTLNTTNSDFKLGGITGHFDDLKIYNYALTATQVADLYDDEAPLPECSITFTQVPAICSGATLSALPTTSNNGITGIWSPALNNTQTTTYTFTPTAGQCTVITPTTMTITVNPNVTPTFTQVSAICSGANISALPTTSNNGITGTWSPALNNTQTTIYTFTPTAGQCTVITPTTMTITVNPNVTPTFTQVPAICSGATLSALLTTSNNGITGTWSPALNNTATTTYTFTPSAGQCATTATMTITVNPNVIPTFIQVSAICSGATLSALPTTSNNGITGTWSPALSNTVTTTYTFTPSTGQCANTATMTITVTPNVTPTFTQVSAICSGATLSALPTTSNNGITGTWSPALNNTATTTYTFTPSTGQCANTATMTITVTQNVTPIFTQVFAICSGATLSALPTTSNNGITGTWSPALNNTATTTYTFTPSAGQCATTATMTITVNPNVTPTFTQVPAICSGATLSALPTTSNNGITGTWSPALNNTQTTTYTFTPSAGQCTVTTPTTMTITVNPNVTPTFTQVPAICSGATLSALSTTSNNGITGTWSPALNNTATTTYTFTPSAGQCATTATMTITVNPVPDQPTGDDEQTFTEGSTLADIVVSPSDVVWYATEQDSLNGTNPLDGNTLLENGQTYFAVSISGDCRSIPFAVTVTLTLGVNDVKKSSLKLYPNPVSDLLTIAAQGKIQSVEVYNIQGQKVVTSNQNQINISDLSSGIYMVKVTDENNLSSTQKIIKK